MDKKIIESGIEYAYNALKSTGITTEDEKIIKGYKSQISTFGAAVTMGSLIPAIAYFSDDGESKVSRKKLMKAIYCVIKKLDGNEEDDKTLFNYACKCKKNGKEAECKEQVINAAISLKLAMNLFVLEKEDENVK